MHCICIYAMRHLQLGLVNLLLVSVGIKPSTVRSLNPWTNLLSSSDSIFLHLEVKSVQFRSKLKHFPVSDMLLQVYPKFQLVLIKKHISEDIVAVLYSLLNVSVLSVSWMKKREHMQHSNESLPQRYIYKKLDNYPFHNIPYVALGSTT